MRKAKERAVINRHPWIFSGAIEKEEGPPDAAIADLISSTGSRVASGFYSEASQIRLRALTFDEELTAALLRDRIAAAVKKRHSIPSSETSAFRIVNSEGDDLSGLVADRYGEVIVLEVTSAGLEKLRPLIVEQFRALPGVKGIFFRNDLGARRIEKLSLVDEVIDEVSDPLFIRENGLEFEVDTRKGQKTGFFLDQRDNRLLTRQLASGASVLNLFSYSGGFGVAASAGGAHDVEEVDISAEAIELAKRNHARNPGAAAVTFEVADVFSYTRKLVHGRRQFDLVICDPPAFAKSRGEVERAARGYKDVNLQALKLVAPGGSLLTFSCSGHLSLDLFQKIVFSAALDARRRVSIERRLGAGPDHPISIYCPEGEYLKGFLLRVE
ncbi:MAG TPA: class I SAM-dependent rRNA methyltransferase [Thermoanaerobaculia bacterium]|nr:class I SAM-dependent rRNA methyltransferase [Thermoanaerobaculia bacterium]